ncbi:hypothetical protein KKG66_11125, partial [bacterium]|nr:hypothetical protein [bacterium]
MNSLFCLIAGYLIGGIPFGILITRLVKGIDPRRFVGRKADIFPPHRLAKGFVLAFGVNNLGLKPEEVTRRVAGALEMVGASELAGKAIHTLS